VAALGLGEDVPINTGNASEDLLTLWMNCRMDDPDAGWKGSGVWTTVSTRAPFDMETGEGTTSKVMEFQRRPDPLSR
jgi:hypothetical protein